MNEYAKAEAILAQVNEYIEKLSALNEACKDITFDTSEWDIVDKSGLRLKVSKISEKRRYSWKTSCYLYSYAYAYRISEVYQDLSIFDWWGKTLSLSSLKKMRSFLETAIKLGFKGYVCFKVGATGCSNGMWAHTEESTDGYSPKGDYIYHSFTPAYSTWSAYKDGKYLEASELGKPYEKVTLKDCKAFLGA